MAYISSPSRSAREITMRSYSHWTGAIMSGEPVFRMLAHPQEFVHRSDRSQSLQGDGVKHLFDITKDMLRDYFNAYGSEPLPGGGHRRRRGEGDARTIRSGRAIAEGIR